MALFVESKKRGAFGFFFLWLKEVKEQIFRYAKGKE